MRRRMVLCHSRGLGMGLLLITSLCVGVPAESWAGEAYVRFDGGVSVVRGFDVRFAETGTRSPLQFENGIQLSLAGGRPLPWNFGVEAEIGLIYNKLKNSSRFWGNSGQLSQVPLFLNLVWRPRFGNFAPFAGIGGGGVLNQLYMEGRSLGSSGFTPNESGSDFVLGYHGIAGLSYVFGRTWNVLLIYNLQSTRDATWDFDTNIHKTGRTDDIVSYSLSLGQGHTF